MSVTLASFLFPACPIFLLTSGEREVLPEGESYKVRAGGLVGLEGGRMGGNGTRLSLLVCIFAVICLDRIRRGAKGKGGRGMRLLCLYLLGRFRYLGSAGVVDCSSAASSSLL